MVYLAIIFIVYAVVIKYYPKCLFLSGFNLAALLFNRTSMPHTMQAYSSSGRTADITDSPGVLAVK